MRLSILSMFSIFTSVENFNIFCLILKSIAWSSLQTTHTCLQTCVLNSQTWETEIMHFLRSSKVLASSSSWAFCCLLRENDKVMDRWGAPSSATLCKMSMFMVYWMWIWMLTANLLIALEKFLVRGILFESQKFSILLEISLYHTFLKRYIFFTVL